jgi:hypothetical protein
MKTRIHVNQHNIRANSKGADLAVTNSLKKVINENHERPRLTSRDIRRQHTNVVAYYSV